MNINLETLFLRLASDVDLDPPTVRYCLNRLRREGAPFLTKTLPSLAKAVVQSIEFGKFVRPTAFAWQGRSLRFFRSLLSGIFRDDGTVRPDADALALYRLRQLCEYCYKLALDFSPSDLIAAERKFIETDADLERAVDEEYVEILRKDFETFFPEISRAEAHEIFRSSRPKPGPGTFAGKGDGWFHLKTNDRNPPQGCEAFSGFFKPYPGFCRSSQSRFFGGRHQQQYTACKPDTSAVSELLFVPKDSRGPRTIVREPYRRLMAQMALHGWLKRALERATNYRVNFESQLINRELAWSSSITKEYCTLDLESASDRVSFSAVRNLCRNSPGIRLFLRKFRTKEVLTPSGGTWRLRKLSGMGSGFTFPLMSLLIYLSIVRAIANYYGGGRRAYKSAMRCVYVYGDDIMVPVVHFETASRALARVGLRVNANKSFWRSSFRESCGGDFYNGNDVAPVRLKLANAGPVLNGNILSFKNYSMSILGVERHCRELVKAGLLRLANYLYSVLEAEVGKLPLGTGETPYLCRWTDQPFCHPVREDTGEHKEIRLLLPVPKTTRGSRDLYIYLASKLGSDDPTFRWVSALGLNTAGNGSFDEVEIPREIRLIRRKVSSFALMG